METLISAYDILYRKRHMDKENMFKTWMLNYTDLTPCYDEQDEVGEQKSQIHINQVRGEENT